MENEETYDLMVRKEKKPLTASEILAQVRLIQEVMNAVMQEGHHYGKIPGTPKPTLYKPGAEKLLSTFHIGVDPRNEIADLSNEDEIRYRVLIKGFSQATDNLLGVGLGECSSNEEKYKWRKPVCDEEFEEMPTDRKRVVWKKGEIKAYQQKQVRMNPIDVANTILKMAKKRALIDMTLTVIAASDIFDQDLEDLPEGMELGINGKPPIKMPKQKETSSENGKTKNTETIVTGIDKITQKEGKKKDGKLYTLYQIVAGEKTYSTFDKKIFEEVKAAIQGGLQVTMEFKQTQYGLEIVSLKTQGPPEDENAQ
jgi:hypothetical protein